MPTYSKSFILFFRPEYLNIHLDSAVRIDPIPASARDAQRVALEMVGVDNTTLHSMQSSENKVASGDSFPYVIMTMHAKLFAAIEDGGLLGATTSDLKILCPRGFTVGKHAIALRAVRHHESLSMPHLRPQWFSLIEEAQQHKNVVPFRSADGSMRNYGDVPPRPDEEASDSEDSKSWKRQVKKVVDAALPQFNMFNLDTPDGEVSSSKMREAIVRVEPKTFFALQRTLLDWCHMCVL